MTNKMMWFTRNIAFLILAIGLITPAHSQQRSKQSQLMKSQQDPIEISQYELRIIMNDYFVGFSGLVEEAADSIITLSSDPQVKENALMWKMYSIPAAQRSIMVTDPFAGFTDAAVLSTQMQQFFESGAGKDLFGEHQPIAIRTSIRLADEMDRIGSNLSPNRDISRGKELIMGYVEKNPIRTLHFTRRSTLPFQARLMEVEKVRFKALAENMAASFEELSTRLNLYIEAIPKQVRWQSEYLLNQTIEKPEIQSRIDSLLIALTIARELTEIVDRLAVVAERTPDLVVTERQAVLSALVLERQIILDAIREEREIISSDLAVARDQTLEGIWKEISRERQESFQEVEAIFARTVDRSFDRMDSLLAKIFGWVMLMLLVAFVAGGLLIILYKRLLK